MTVNIMTKLIFESSVDRELFLHDLNPDLDKTSISNILESMDDSSKSVDSTDLKVFKTALEDREDRKIKLRDWNKSALIRKQWRTNRRKMMAGIRRFHRSTKGKQFHRELGRKVATRDWSSVNTTEYSIKEKSEILSALSSLKTHLFIGLKYTSSIDEEVSYQLLCEEASAQISDIESNILESLYHNVNISLDDDQLELLRDLVIMTNLGEKDV